MKIHLSFKLIPELIDLNPELAGKIWKNNYLKAFLHWETWASLLLGAFVTGACAVIGEMFQDKFNLDTMIGLKHFTLVVGTCIGALIGGLIYTQTLVLHARFHIREYIHAHKTELDVH